MVWRFTILGEGGKGCRYDNDVVNHCQWVKQELKMGEQDSVVGVCCGVLGDGMFDILEESLFGCGSIM